MVLPICCFQYLCEACRLISSPAFSNTGVTASSFSPTTASTGCIARYTIRQFTSMFTSRTTSGSVRLHLSSSVISSFFSFLSTVPTPFASHAFHPLDGYLQSVPYPLFIFLFPLHRWLYLGLFVFVNFWSILVRFHSSCLDASILTG